MGQRDQTKGSTPDTTSFAARQIASVRDSMRTYFFLGSGLFAGGAITEMVADEGTKLHKVADDIGGIGIGTAATAGIARRMLSDDEKDADKPTGRSR